jgi:hypothetical protein
MLQRAVLRLGSSFLLEQLLLLQVLGTLLFELTALQHIDQQTSNAQYLYRQA